MKKKAKSKEVKVPKIKSVVIKIDKMPEFTKKEPLSMTVVKPKIKVLWWSDFLRHTGFGNVAEEIVSRLYATGKYEFAVIGINHMGVPYCTPSSDYYHLKDIPVYPAFTGGPNSSLFGYDVVGDFLKTQKFDVFFALQDSFNLIPLKEDIIEARKKRKFKYILYFPVDGGVKEEWVEDGIKIADIPVTYTEYGVKEIEKYNKFINLKVIPHGIDLAKFYPFKTEEERNTFRMEHFNIGPETFLITNVNRNQPRKDLPRMILAFGEFCKRNRDIKAKLYLHCISNDGAGHKLHEFTKQYLPRELHERIVMPSASSMGGNGVPVAILNKVYGASDIITSTTLGEGWGLSTGEAMACKTPVVMPNNSASPALIGENEERGYLVKCGGDINNYFVQRYDNELMRPLTDIHDLISIWEHIYRHPNEAKLKAEEAYKWIQNYTWDIIVKRWEDILDAN